KLSCHFPAIFGPAFQLTGSGIQRCAGQQILLVLLMVCLSVYSALAAKPVPPYTPSPILPPPAPATPLPPPPPPPPPTLANFTASPVVFVPCIATASSSGSAILCYNKNYT